MSRPIDRFLARVEDASSTSTSVDVNGWFSELVTENLLAVFFGLATDVQGDEDGQRLVKCITESFNATKTGGRLDIYKGRVFNCMYCVYCVLCVLHVLCILCVLCVLCVLCILCTV